ncbi:MAG: winged helix-turn-helix domain-containing protein [Candidatus Bathyarchaeia archaeon]
MRRNRNETELIALVLACCEVPKRISTIIREVNIPHNRLQPMLDRLIAGGLVSKEEHSEALYTTTDAGRAFLAEYRRFQKLCDAYAIKA